MDVLTVNFRAPNAPNALTQSFKETGFAVIKDHPISKQLIDRCYQDWQQFFAQQAEFKNQYLYQREAAKQDGYFPYLSENAKDNALKDLKEFYHVFPGGRYPECISAATWQLYVELSNLAGVLLEWLDAQTPAEIRQYFSMPLAKMAHQCDRTLLRILNYPPLSGAETEGAVRAAAHEDINLLTLLPAATTTGLQVKDRLGQWHDVPADYGTIVVNVGDALQLCSRGYYRSTTHQVVNPQGEAAKLARLSMPLFLHPHPEVQLSPQHTAESYLRERLEAIGLA